MGNGAPVECVAEYLANLPEGAFPFGREVKCRPFRVLIRGWQGVPQCLAALFQLRGGVGVPFCRKSGAEFLRIFQREALPGHLAGGFRQLVGLVHHEDSEIVEQGRQPPQPVDGVCQQVVVVADLDGKFSAAGFFQILAVAAGFPRTAFGAHLRNTDLPPVEAA